MSEVKGKLVTPVGFRADGTVRALELTDSDELKVSANATVLASMLTALEKIDDLRNALDSVNTDEIVVNVDQSVLPTGAALATLQATMITSLQLIDDLRGALDSVDTDELVVNVDESVLPTGAATSAAQATLETEVGKSLKTLDLELVSKILSIGIHGWYGAAWGRQPVQFGFSGTTSIAMTNTELPAGNSTQLSVTTVPANTVYTLTNFIYRVDSASITRVEFLIRVSAVSRIIKQIWDFDTTYWVGVEGTFILGPGDQIGAYVYDATLNDNIYMEMTGYKTNLAD